MAKKDLENLETLIQLKTSMNPFLEELLISLERIKRMQKNNPQDERIRELIKECLLSVEVAQEKLAETKKYLEAVSESITECAKKNT